MKCFFYAIRPFSFSVSPFRYCSIACSNTLAKFLTLLSEQYFVAKNIYNTIGHISKKLFSADTVSFYLFYVIFSINFPSSTGLSHRDNDYLALISKAFGSS